MMSLPDRPLRSLRRASGFVLDRMRNPVFWQVQAMVFFFTGLHYLLEYLEVMHLSADLAHIHHVPVMLYVIPITYAGLRFGWEGGLLTGAWGAILTVPNIVFWHRDGFEWVVETINVGVALGVGVVVAMVVEHQRRERRRAENLARRLLHAHEEERRRIARDLHDGPVQALVYLLDDLDGLLRDRALNGGPAETIAEARSIADSALRDIRTFSRDLRPSVLDDLGLVPALEWLTRAVTDRGHVTVELRVAGSPTRLAPEEELALFRIAQEALYNVERHAEAGRATVEVHFSPGGHWSMRVQDDGRGFDPRTTVGDLVARGHLGLHGMHERADLVGARLFVETAPGRGTTVEVVSSTGADATPDRLLRPATG